MNIEEVDPMSYSWIRYGVARVNANKNLIIFTSAPTGGGKSWTDLSICYLFSRALKTPFGIDNVFTSHKESMKFVNSDKVMKGSVFDFEEVGVTQSSRNWQSVNNKVMNYFLQTCRHRNFILVMNSPYLDFVDSQTRRLFHAELKVIGIDYAKQETLVKPYCLQYNPRNKKTYYKYLRIKQKGTQGLVPVKLWRVPRPPQWLIDAYEKKKLEFTTQLNEQILEDLEKEESGGKKKQGVLSIEQQKTYYLLKEKLTVPQICVRLNVKKSWVYDCIKKIGLKGHTITPVYSDDGLERVLHYEVG